jgi:hypothetical protein
MLCRTRHYVNTRQMSAGVQACVVTSGIRHLPGRDNRYQDGQLIGRTLPDTTMVAVRLQDEAADIWSSVEWLLAHGLQMCE